MATAVGGEPASGCAAQVGFELTIFLPLLSIASAGTIGPRHHACLDVPVFRIDSRGRA